MIFANIHRWSKFVTAGLFLLACGIVIQKHVSLQRAFVDQEVLIASLRSRLIARATLKPLKAVLPRVGMQRAANCDGASDGPCQGEPAPLHEITAESLGANAATALRARLGVSHSSSALLIVLYSPTDCPVCLQEASVWEGLNQDLSQGASPALSIVSIVDRSTAEEAPAAAASLGLTIPSYLDDESVVRDALGASSTPYKILFDSSGNLLMVDRPNRTLEEQKHFGDRVRSLVHQQSKGG